MLLVHAGNRIDAPGRPDVRFPAENIGDVHTRVGRLMSALRPIGVVSAPAAGADLIVLEEATSRGIPIHLVLPLAAAAFEAASVADLGERWVRAYRRVLEHAGEAPNTTLELGLEEGTDWYRSANGHLLDRARALAGDAGTPLAALTIRPRAGGDPASVTDDFAARAEVSGVPVLTIDPSRARRQLRTAFVVMPFGRRSIPSTGEPIDCDRVLEKLFVPALEDADLDWQRADRSLDAGIVHVDMVDQLGRADLVIVDVVTQDANVFYGLGLRHALADRVTLLAGPDGVHAPFDAPGIRRFSYPLAGSSISDAEAIEGWRRLAPVLADTLGVNAPDSPVFSDFTLGRKHPPQRRELADATARALTRLRSVITDAEQQDRVGDLIAALATFDEVERTTALDPDDRAVLLLRLGAALRRHGDTDRAVDVLRRAELAADHPAYAALRRELAMAWRRAAEGARDATVERR